MLFSFYSTDLCITLSIRQLGNHPAKKCTTHPSYRKQASERELQAAGPGTHSKLIMALWKLLWQCKTKKPLTNAGKPRQKTLDTENNWGNRYLTLLDWVCVSADLCENVLSGLKQQWWTPINCPQARGGCACPPNPVRAQCGFCQPWSFRSCNKRFTMRFPCPGWLRRSQLTRFLCKTNV